MKRTNPMTGETVETHEERTEAAVETCAWDCDHCAEHAGRYLQAERHPSPPGASVTTAGGVTTE